MTYHEPPHCHRHAGALFASTKSKEIDFTRHRLPPPTKFRNRRHRRRSAPTPTGAALRPIFHLTGKQTRIGKYRARFGSRARVREWKTSARVISGTRLSTLYCPDGWLAGWLVGSFRAPLIPLELPSARNVFCSLAPFLRRHCRPRIRGRTVVNRPPYVALLRLSI